MRRLWKFRLSIPLVLLVIVLFVGSIPLQLKATSSPKFCASCHEMKSVAASFKTSTHAAVGCIGCHTDPGQLNFVRDKIRDGTKDIYGHFFGYKKPIRTHIPNERCLSCHPTIPQRNVFLQLEVAHDKHIERGIACTTCHLRVGHQSMTLSSAARLRTVAASFEQTHREITLKTCFASGCHDNRAAKTACVTCHVDQQRVKPRSHTPAFLDKHGTMARTNARDCMTCHKSEATLVSALARAHSKVAAFTQLVNSTFCKNCHSQWNPHPAAFETNHGDAAQAPNANCAICHKNSKTFCDACHGMAMPHPKNFMGRHGKLAEASTARCMHCHNAKSDCEGCHHATRPATHSVDFREKHGVLAKAATQNCLLCHRKSTCDSCHQLPMPHPAKYSMNHTVDASRRESACANCHRKKDCLKCHENEEIHLPNVRLEEPPKRDSPRAIVEWLRVLDQSGCPAQN